MPVLIPVFLLLSAQEAAPVVPAMASRQFLEQATEVQRALESGDFDTARAKAARLPKREFVLQYDDAPVPERRKKAFRAAVEQAVAEWAEAVPEVKIRLGQGTDLVVNFVETLPPPPDGFRPAGAVSLFSEALGEPRLEAVLALKREDPPQPVEPNDVRNEIAFAIGAYLGLAESPKGMSVMRRVDTLTSVATGVTALERSIALETLSVSDTLRKAAVDGRRLVASLPKAEVRQSGFEAGPVIQGAVLEWEIEISNQGNAPLRIAALPDCGCFAVQYQQQLDPGQSSLVKVYANTFDVPGPFDKKVILQTNDPDRPEIVCRFVSKVRPIYRLLRKEGSGPVFIGPEGGEAAFYLVYQPERKFRLLGEGLAGVKGELTVSPWQGELADSAYGEPEGERFGYKVKVKFDPGQVEGRKSATLTFKTDDPDFPTIYANFSYQSGIAAVPNSLYFGDLARSPRRADFLVSRPGRPFKVTGVRSASAYVEASALPYRDAGDYRVIVEILPGAPAGQFQSEVIVLTDDPAQPEIRVALSAVVR